MGPFSDLSAEGFRGVTVALVKHGDVINEATNNIFWRHGHTAMAHLKCAYFI